MSKPLFWTLIGGAGALVCCVCGPVPVALVEMPFYLATGWAVHIHRLANETEIDWPAVATIAGTLVLFTFGLHRFCRWYYAARRPGEIWQLRWSLCVTAIMLLAFGAGIAAIGITHQAFWLATAKERLALGGRQAAGRVQATNNMKQIGLAVHDYHDAAKHLPPGSTFDEQGRGLHNWQTLLLPYLDQGPLFHKIDMQKPWNAPGNAEAMMQNLYVFRSPLIDSWAKEGVYPHTHFSGNAHVLSVKPMKLLDIGDGASNTMLMGEIAGNFRPWGMPGNWRDPALGLHHGPDSFGGPGARVTIILMCDGTVRQVRNDIGSDVMKALGTPNGGETVDLQKLEP